MRKRMIFFILLPCVLFVYELNLVLNDKGNWVFVWINVFIFFLAVLAAAGDYENEAKVKKTQKRRSGNLPRKMSHVQKPFFGDSRKFQ